MMDDTISPLLRLPLEIRLIIYEHLLFPSTLPSSSHTTSVSNLLPDFHTYHSDDTNDTPFTLAVRTIDPYAGAHNSRSWKRRSTYHVRTGTLYPTIWHGLLRASWLCDCHNVRVVTEHQAHFLPPRLRQPTAFCFRHTRRTCDTTFPL